MNVLSGILLQIVNYHKGRDIIFRNRSDGMWNIGVKVQTVAGIHDKDLLRKMVAATYFGFVTAKKLINKDHQKK